MTQTFNVGTLAGKPNDVITLDPNKPGEVVVVEAAGAVQTPPPIQPAPPASAAPVTTTQPTAPAAAPIVPATNPPTQPAPVEPPAPAGIGAIVSGAVAKAREYTRPALARRSGRRGYKTRIPSTDHPTTLLFGALTGLALVGAALLVSWITTMDFVHAGLHWRLMVTSPAIDFGPFQGKYSIDALWLIPIGGTAFELAYKPPLSVKEALRYLIDDPIMFLLWLVITSFFVGSTFFGVIDWLSTVTPNFNHPFVMGAAFVVSAGLEYYCEPLSRKFSAEVKAAFMEVIR